MYVEGADADRIFLYIPKHSDVFVVSCTPCIVATTAVPYPCVKTNMGTNGFVLGKQDMFVSFRSKV